MQFVHCFTFYLLSVGVNLFAIFSLLAYYADQFSTVFHHEILQKYDYIIVGAGTAGSLIANRIATETPYSYIVLEAGGHSNWVFDVPMLGPLLHGSDYDWQYQTVPQTGACLAMEGQNCRLPLGKIVGGSSKLNNMIHIRGNISHYANWFHSKHSEDFIEKQFNFIEQEYINLDKIKYESELADAILEAAKELGFKNVDINSEFKTGFMKSVVSQKNGKRWSTSNNIDHRNVLTNAIVEKVIIDKENIAHGIRYIQGGVTKEIFARKAVIITAGTYNTPKILQLSGIGPKKILETLRIKVIKDLPVGENLQDHITTGLDLVHFNQSLKIGPLDILNLNNVYKYFIEGNGPLTTPGCEVVGFLSTKKKTMPDIQFMVLPVGITSDKGSHLRKVIGIKDEVWSGYFQKSLDNYTASILPILLHPKSKGVVKIISRDPQEPPYIDPKFLSHEEDIEVLVQGLKFVVDFVNTKAMKKIGAQLNPHPFTGCENYKLFSDSYWKCYVTSLTLTSYHPVGTCSMGLATSKTSVVDISFEVIGVKRLYLADGSVLPTLPSGNINAAIAMMASIFFETNIRSKLKSKEKETIEEYLKQEASRVTTLHRILNSIVFTYKGTEHNNIIK